MAEPADELRAPERVDPPHEDPSGPAQASPINHMSGDSSLYHTFPSLPPGRCTGHHLLGGSPMLKNKRLHATTETDGRRVPLIRSRLTNWKTTTHIFLSAPALVVVIEKCKF